ncbi:hypothetical protein F8M41_000024 [Gigaspora margarita]|uniref:Uncharacterized protein n=1 Tax=Gigaspora margarita TaxID=4874 RepID=A0A8H4B5Z3_GIGMA|nr:hypothetical protein F8M41_000024 [Gigaspora margarita]
MQLHNRAIRLAIRHLNLKKKQPKIPTNFASHEKFIFASILFALLLTVNAAPFQLNKRAITFGSCSDIGVPVDLLEAGTPFNISASDVPIPKSPVSYTIVVIVGDLSDDPLSLPFACAYATAGGSSEKSKIFVFKLI